jgi:DNA invertase Pin-like site-specific DNA recombinase
MRTREGMKVARAKGRLRGKQPKLKPAQEAHLVELWRAGQRRPAHEQLNRHPSTNQDHSQR